MSALTQIIPELIAIVVGYGTFSSVSGAPTVSFVSPGTIAQEVCGRPCPAYAMFDPDRGILLDERLDPLNDVNARSILLHELVHYVQWKSSGHMPDGCEDLLQRESDAYEIQFAWLARQTKGIRKFPVRKPVLSPIVCGDRS